MTPSGPVLTDAVRATSGRSHDPMRAGSDRSTRRGEATAGSFNRVLQTVRDRQQPAPASERAVEAPRGPQEPGDRTPTGTAPAEADGIHAADAEAPSPTTASLPHLCTPLDVATQAAPRPPAASAPDAVGGGAAPDAAARDGEATPATACDADVRSGTDPTSAPGPAPAAAGTTDLTGAAMPGDATTTAPDPATATVTAATTVTVTDGATTSTPPATKLEHGAASAPAGHGRASGPGAASDVHPPTPLPAEAQDTDPGAVAPDAPPSGPPSHDAAHPGAAPDGAAPGGTGSATASSPTRTSPGQGAAGAEAVDRVLRLAEQLRAGPPPRAMTVDLEALGGARVVVRVSGDVVAVTPASGAALDGQLAEDLARSLADRGMSLAGGSEGRQPTERDRGDDAHASSDAHAHAAGPDDHLSQPGRRTRRWTGLRL